MRNLNDKRVVITGGGSGIGRLMAIFFAREGAQIVVWDINPDATARVTDRIEREGGKASAYVCDVSDRRQVYQTAEKVKRVSGPAFSLGCVISLPQTGIKPLFPIP